MQTRLRGVKLHLLRGLVQQAGGRTRDLVVPHEVAARQGIAASDLLELEDWLVAEGYLRRVSSDYVSVTHAGVEAIEQLGSGSEGNAMLDTVEKRTKTKLFVSHAATDKDLARQLVELIDAVLEMPRDAIRCTSVEGYRLLPGDDTSHTLRQNLQDADVVLGLLTPNSLRSHYVLLELGAAWGFQKVSIPLLTPGVDFSDLPGPFKEIHAIRATEQADVVAMIDRVEQNCGLHKRVDMSRIFAKVGAFVTGASASRPSPPGPTLPEAGLGVLPQADDDILMNLRGWLKRNEFGTDVAAGHPVAFEAIDSEAGVPAGSAARLLHDALAPLWAVEHRSSSKVTLRKLPARITRTRR